MTLRGALGSFVLYAAIAGVEYDVRRESAKVTHIVVYVKDHYTFDGEEGSTSQYLGHWSKNGVIVVPIYEVAKLTGFAWLDYPVVLGGNYSVDLYKDGQVYYPVRNNLFRKWQMRQEMATGGIGVAAISSSCPITSQFVWSGQSRIFLMNGLATAAQESVIGAILFIAMIMAVFVDFAMVCYVLAHKEGRALKLKKAALRNLCIALGILFLAGASALLLPRAQVRARRRQSFTGSYRSEMEDSTQQNLRIFGAIKYF
ncbi:MAG: hypothetical protein CPDRYMAC_7001 [uncultured Paraburkholderia sp.]|nr:MAG: hypothetical protein CPDRYDRY_6963 [uncultured Paraburkholderia sp.]CAH2945684.1 MAG: hypothetical protein CPDRYMAC_7001 [uncultured Paraburkholderia sp.]